MISKLTLILFLLMTSLSYAGSTTTNGYYYLPSRGASGASEWNAWFNSLEATDGVLGLMRSASYWTRGASSTLTGETDLESANLTITGTWNFGSGKLVLPSGASLTSTDCDAADEAGRTFVKTNGTSGQQLYVCEGLAGWVLQGSGGGGVIALGDDTSGNYVATITSGLGMDCSSSTEGGTPTCAFDESASLSGDHTLTSNQIKFGSGGLISEGSTANTIETYLAFPDPATTDKTLTLPNETGTICSTGSICSGYQGSLSSGGNVGVGTTLASGGTAIMNGNLGVGTWIPTAKLEVKGLIKTDTGVNFPDGTTQTSAASGSGFTDGGTNVYTTSTSDNVGIGTTTPASNVKLDVRGGNVAFWTGSGTNNNATSAGEAYVQGDLEVDGTIYGGASAGFTVNGQSPCLADGTNCPAAAGNGWTDGGTNVYTSTTTDAVGLGTTTPSGTLEIVKQSTSIPLMVSATATGDGNYLIVTSAGNVGIGTVLPGTVLDVQGQGRFTSLSFSGSAGQTNFANSSGFAFDPSNATMTTPKLTLTPGGNVGINTSTATTALQVAGTVTATAFAGDGSALTGITSSGFTDDGTNVRLTTSSDNVGIGTTTALARVHVYGSTGDFRVRSTATNSYTEISLRDDTNAEFTIGKAGSAVNDGDSNSRGYLYQSSNAPIVFSTNATERMRITGGGNVGIGTANPANGHLHLPANGTATGKVLCFGTNNCVGYCTSLTAATGVCSSCTCF